MKEYAVSLLIRRMTLSQVIVLNQKLATVPSPLVSPNRLMVPFLLRAMKNPQIKHLVKYSYGFYFLCSSRLLWRSCKFCMLLVAVLARVNSSSWLSSLMSVRLRSVDFADNFLFNEAVEEESV